MRVLGVELRRLDLELTRSLATGVGSHSRRPVLIVRADTDLGIGWGECDALESPTYTAEYADGAERVLSDYLIPLLLGAAKDLEGAPDVARVLAPIRGHPMAKAALEMAVLDAELRAAGESLAHRLGVAEPSVVAGATVGFGPVATVVADVAEAVGAGFTRVKCKIVPGMDVEQLRAVRSSFPGLDLCVDANGSYSLVERADRIALEALDALDLLAIEQPLAADDLSGHARLTERLRSPVVLDESIDSTVSLEAALALRACTGISLKPARVGGVLAALRLHDRCVKAGIRLSAGGMLETGLARAASIAVAALPGFDLPGDLGPSDRYFVPDLTVAHVLNDGRLTVPDGPGIGVEPLADVLDAATVRYRMFTTT